MRFDVVELIQEMDFKDTGLQLGLQCAPLFAGVKASNLFTLSRSKVFELEKLLLNTDLSYELLYEGDERVVYLIYDRNLLEAFIARDEVKEALTNFGYSSVTICSLFPVFKERYLNYMREKKDFPHELGFLLEYPVEDIMGFVENKGKNFLYSGYWKVYAEKEEKIKLFEVFERVQKEIVSLILEEFDLKDIIALYRKKRKHSSYQEKAVQVA